MYCKLKCIILLSPCLLLSRVTCVTDYPTFPCLHLARSQSCNFHVPLACPFPSCFPLCYLSFTWYTYPWHFPQYVFFVSFHHMPILVQSSLRDLFGSLRHSRFPSVPNLIVVFHPTVASSSHSPQSILLVVSP